ncbi:SMI1/KNR4 family protein [Aquabacterium humicola]|uniref:SMI1/KNR4 family protein n=1 Tax=Aquabacterium humicola TaxID=3237377 RepID=UPI002542A7DD|nr:SMI1/KNR4 family protein [Rubrivivax pictus]
MSEIEQLLRNGKSRLDEFARSVTETDLDVAESMLPFALPTSYREFVALGGLNELRINHRVLHPSEIAVAIKQVDQTQYVPFADNGCGDVYCWMNTGEPEPPVVLADHESSQYVQDSPSFADWLRKNRF